MCHRCRRRGFAKSEISLFGRDIMDGIFEIVKQRVWLLLKTRLKTSSVLAKFGKHRGFSPWIIRRQWWWRRTTSSTILTKITIPEIIKLIMCYRKRYSMEILQRKLLWVEEHVSFDSFKNGSPSYALEKGKKSFWNSFEKNLGVVYCCTDKMIIVSRT